MFGLVQSCSFIGEEVWWSRDQKPEGSLENNGYGNWREKREDRKELIRG